MRKHDKLIMHAIIVMAIIAVHLSGLRIALEPPLD